VNFAQSHVAVTWFVERPIAVLLGLVLLAAATAKLLRGGRTEFISSLELILGIADLRLRRLLLMCTVGAEYVIGLGLVFMQAAHDVWLSAFSLLLLLFTAVLAVTIARGVRASCPCFGRTSSKQVGIRDLGRNFALLGVALVVLCAKESSMFWPMAVVAILVLSGTQVVLLARMNARIERLALRETDIPAFGPPLVGVKLPPVEGLAAGARNSRTTLIALLSPGCGGCLAAPDALTEIVESLGVDVVGAIDMRVADPGEVAELQKALEHHSIRSLTRDDANAVIAALEVQAFPSFVVADDSLRVTASCVGLGDLQSLCSERGAATPA
jgi:thiol-disulfide isomerase/thioredoxin